MFTLNDKLMKIKLKKIFQKLWNLPLTLVTLSIVLFLDDLMWQIGTSENLTPPKNILGVFMSGNISSFLKKIKLQS